MGWVPSTPIDATLIAVRREPGTTSQIARRVEDTYQPTYQRLRRLEQLFLVERPRKDNGAWLWRPTSRDRRRELCEATRSAALPSDAERELAEALGRKEGVEVRLELDDEPDMMNGRMWWWGQIVIVTRRGSAQIAVPMLAGEPQWRSALEEAFA